MYVSDHLFNPRAARVALHVLEDARTARPGWEDRHGVARPHVRHFRLAGATENLVFTTGIYIAPLRDLITVAKTVGTAAVLSDNRLRLGIGVGWSKEEFDLTGQDFATRGKRLDEMIVALRALWRGGWVEFHGDFYDVPECQMEPAPTEPVPIIGGGHSPVALRRTAALCDGWIAAGAYSEEEAWIHLADLRDALKKAGRDKDEASPSTCRSTSGRASTCTAALPTPASPTSCAPLDVRRRRAGDSRRRGAGRPAGRGALVRRGDRGQGLTYADRREAREEPHVKTMKIGLQLGYWGSGPPPNAVES